MVEVSVVRCCGNSTRPRRLSGGGWVQSDRVAVDTITSWRRNVPLTSNNNMIGERALHTRYGWLMILRRVARSCHNFAARGRGHQARGGVV